MGLLGHRLWIKPQKDGSATVNDGYLEIGKYPSLDIAEGVVKALIKDREKREYEKMISEPFSLGSINRLDVLNSCGYYARDKDSDEGIEELQTIIENLTDVEMERVAFAMANDVFDRLYENIQNTLIYLKIIDKSGKPTKPEIANVNN